MRKGEKMSERQRQKISTSKKGTKPWNKNLTGYSTSRKGMRGIYSQKTLKKMSLAKLGKTSPTRGKKLTQETKDRISLSLKGRVFSDETKEKNRQSQYLRHFKENPEYIPDSSLDLRKKRIRESGSSHTFGDWQTLKAQYNWTCPCCHTAEPKIKLTRDHIIPISKGGSDNIENIQPLCHSCNCKKHTKTIRY